MLILTHPVISNITNGIGWEVAILMSDRPARSTGSMKSRKWSRRITARQCTCATRLSMANGSDYLATTRHHSLVNIESPHLAPSLHPMPVKPWLWQKCTKTHQLTLAALAWARAQWSSEHLPTQRELLSPLPTKANIECSLTNCENPRFLALQ